MKFIEVFDSGIVNHSTMESRFVREIADRYDLTVIFTDFGMGKEQARLDCYLDFRDVKTPFARHLQENLRRNEVVGYSLETETAYDPEIVQFSKELCCTYLQAFGFVMDSLPEIYVYAHDFYRSCLARMHSLAKNEIASMLCAKYGVSVRSSKILVWYEPSVTCIVEEPTCYEQLTNKKSAIIEDAFDIMKQYDSFSHLQKEDVNICILLKSELTPDERNRYARG